MPSAGDPQGSLLNRSPRSRKSLAAAGPAPATVKRKRAHSIAPGENLKIQDDRRRSLMRPTKGILKPSNQAEDATQDLSRAYQTIPMTTNQDDSNMTLSGVQLGEFHTNVRDNDTRKSFGGRRVSFAAHAHVRVFDSAEQNTNGTSSPGSSPASSSSASAPSDPASPSPAPPSPAVPEPQPIVSSQDPGVPASQSPSCRASLTHRRRSSVHGVGDDEGEGEESMDVTDDDIPPPALIPPSVTASPLPPVAVTPATTQQPDNSEDDSDYGGEDGDMSMTGDFGAGIVARRRTMSMAGRGRRKSRMRSSITVPPTESGEEAKEFTVSLDRPPPPESDTLKALKALANGNRVVDDDEEVDMDVTTAMTRLMAVRHSMGGTEGGEAKQDDSFSSTEDSFDAMDTGDRTVNVTNLMSSFRASEYGIDDEGDVTMSATSVVVGPISTRADLSPSTTAPPAFVPSPRPLSQPPPLAILSSSKLHGTPSPLKSQPPRVASPTKQPIKQFTAAFAPQHQAPKRPLASSSSGAQAGLASAILSGPNKRRAVAINESSAQRVSVSVPSIATESSVPPDTSPRKGLPSRARRPSGYYRKSFGGVAASTDSSAPVKQFSSSTAGPQRRQSIAPSAHPPSPKKMAVVPALKSPAFAPKDAASTSVSDGDPACEREDRRQSVALPSPTRGSPSPGSPRYHRIQRANQITSSDAVDEHNVEGKDEEPSVLHLAQSQGIDPAQWASSVQGQGVPQDDDLSPISVDEFFKMTSIRFMDDLTCPRRSTVHPSQLQRRESHDGEDETYLLSDYAIAMAVDVAQLETMTWIANDIRSAIEKFKAQYRQTEDDVGKDIPLLFREFATASEEGREQYLYVLKLIKANTIWSAKASWYEWKRGWVQGLQTNAERTLDNLDADERQLEGLAARARECLPSLHDEYEKITRELAEEQAAVAEIENCDQKFLSELKATIAEQRQELDVYRNDIVDGNAKLVRLDETLEDLEDQAGEAKMAITTAQRQMDMQKSSTRAEVFRLRDELSNLQNLQLWRATELSADMVEFVYDSKYKVVIPCSRFTPIPEALDILPLNEKAHIDDDFPLVTEMMYRIARRRAIRERDDKVTLRTIIQRLTDFWASYAQLRWQLSFIIIKYPLAFQLTPAGSDLDDAQGFKVTATLMLFKKTSKALVSFHFDNAMLGDWPMAVELLKYEVMVAYGNADPQVVVAAVKKRLSEANATENHACLVDACMEVVSRYS